MNKPAHPIAAPSASYPDYEQDGFGWAMAQGALLRQRRFDAIDWDNVAEEIETMGRSERSAYKSQLVRILVPILKWDAQPERRGKSWWLSIMSGRIDAQSVLDENPSLKPFLAEIHETALRLARTRASLETDLPQSLFNSFEISQIDAFERTFERPAND